MNNRTVQRNAYNDNLPAWRNQFIRGPGARGVDASAFKRIALQSVCTSA